MLPTCQLGRLLKLEHQASWHCFLHAAKVLGHVFGSKACSLADACEILLTLKQEFLCFSTAPHVRRFPVLDRLQQYCCPQALVGTLPVVNFFCVVGRILINVHCFVPPASNQCILRASPGAAGFAAGMSQKTNPISAEERLNPAETEPLGMLRCETRCALSRSYAALGCQEFYTRCD